MIKEYNAKNDDEKTEFYTKAKVYLREYAFLAQILPFNDIELEKLSILLKMLIAKIVPPRTEDLAKGILNNVDLNSIRIILESKKDISLSNNGELSPAGADGSSKKEVELERLSNIVREFNTKFGSVDFGTNEKIAKELMDLKDDIAKEQTFRDSLGDEQNARRLFADIFKIQYLQFFKRNKDFFTQLDNKEEFKERVSNAIYEMIDEGYQYNAFKSF